MRVFVVSDTRLVRDALTAALARHADIHVVGSARPSGDAIAALRDAEADVVVIHATGAANHSAIQAISATAYRARVIAFAATLPDTEVIRWIEAGVTGFIASDASADDVVAGIRGAGTGALIAPVSVVDLVFRHVARRTVAPAPRDRSLLSLREVEIAHLLAAGHSNKEIATRLFIEVPTVKNHVHNILEKLGAKRRSEVAHHLLRRSHAAEPAGSIRDWARAS